MKKLCRYAWLLFLLVGCQAQTGEGDEVTPVPTIPAPSGLPVPVELSALAVNPAFYERAYIQLTGQYTRLPRLICDADPQPSPATWGVAADSLLALAGGFDDQLRPLLPEGSPMIVAGRWQHWQGAVGCGDLARSQDIWYLEISQIISPNPIAQIAPVSPPVPAELGDDESPPAATPSAETEPTTPPAAETAVTPTSPSTPPIDPTGAATTAPDQPTATPLASATVTSPSSTTPTPTATLVIGQTTPTPSATPPPGASPTNTVTLGNGDVDRGELDPEILSISALGGDENHRWTFVNDRPNNTLTINAVSANGVDLAIDVFDPDGARLLTQNFAGADQVEAVIELALAATGAYEIVVFAANDVGGDYGLMALDAHSYDITFDVIRLNSPASLSFPEDSEQIWFFAGAEDNVVTITAVPDSATDIGLELIGPDGEILTELDDFGGGETEELADASLPASGLYAPVALRFRRYDGHGRTDGDYSVEV